MIRHLLKLAWHRKGSNALIIVEIFASFMVVFAVAAFGLYLAGNYRRPLGFSYTNVWDVRISAGRATDDEWSDEEVQRFRMLLQDVRGLDGVVAAAGALSVPYDTSRNVGGWQWNGREFDVEFDEVTDDFKDVLGLELVRGRWFEESDSALGWEPMVIDEEMSRASFGDEDPVGKTLPLNGDKGPEARVVGVVREFRKGGEFSGTRNFLFKRIRLGDTTSRPPRNLLLKMRPGLDASVEQALAERLHSSAPGWSFEVRPLEQLRETSMRLWLAPLVVGGIVGGFLLLMTGLGLLGVLWQNVTRRTHEIGLRRATGASREDICRQVLLEVGLTTTLGLLFGVALVLQIPLLGLVGFVDKSVFVLAAAVSSLAIYLLTLACGVYPSLLAARLRPAEALNQE